MIVEVMYVESRNSFDRFRIGSVILGSQSFFILRREFDCYVTDLRWSNRTDLFTPSGMESGCLSV